CALQPANSAAAVAGHTRRPPDRSPAPLPSPPSVCPAPSTRPARPRSPDRGCQASRRYGTFSIVYRSRNAPPGVAQVSPLGQSSLTTQSVSVVIEQRPPWPPVLWVS